MIAMMQVYSGEQVVVEGFTQWHSDGTEILNTNSSPGAPRGTGVCVWECTR